MPYLILVIGCIGLSISSIGLNIPYIQKLDASAVIWMSQHRSTFSDGIAIALSHIGGLPSILLIYGIWCLQQIHLKKYTGIVFAGLGILGSSAIGWILKYLVNRPRPDAVYQMVETHGASFPSAHSIYAVVTAYLLFLFYKHSRIKIIGCIAGLWWLVMGVSRVYLGVHFPTDVLAGWSIGLIWITILTVVFPHFLSTDKLFLDKNLNEVK
ncbi:phosphatase PAP2 family protein [Acinetobacter sp. WZC-1]|uniref:phosphatase PAP2 family protein n=1 Tax=Acinetobacter sp. WZC-1 TaxID=3459034 RepID=UPI00403D5766